MNGRDFYVAVKQHDELEWLGVLEGDTKDEAVVVYKRLDAKHVIGISTILNTSWDELEAILTHQRDTKIMIHLSRIVGYYSRISNWNLSKLAELKDRQAGSYTAPEEQPKKAKKVMVHGVVGRQGVGAKGGTRTRTLV